MTKIPKFTADSDDPDVKMLADGLNLLGQCLLERTPLKGEKCEIDFHSHGFRPKPKPPAPAPPGGEASQFRVYQVMRDHLVCNPYKESYTQDANGFTVMTPEIDDETFVDVAKPHTLRATPWDYTLNGGQDIDGKRYTFNSNGNSAEPNSAPDPWNYRIAEIMAMPELRDTTGTFSETLLGVRTKEKIFPEYYSGAIIYAAKVKEAPVVRQFPRLYQVSPPLSTTDVDAEWVDLNVDGRTWQMLWRSLEVCVDLGTGNFSRQRVMVRASEFVV